MTSRQSDIVEIGKRLRAAREALGLSQELLAQSAGYSRMTVLRAENGQRISQLETLRDLCKVLKVDIGEILR